jgi:hypothetical protein
MKTILILVALAAGAMADADHCPAFRDWRAWTDHCIWFPMNTLRHDLIHACDVKMDETKMAAFPNIPGIPEKCGHCSFKARCRKRAKTDGCNPIEFERQPCNEHGNVCTMPQFPLYNLGCRYEYAPIFLKQCANQAGIADWQRSMWHQKGKVLPKFHCTEVGEPAQCKCCCHPYEPNEDGTACVEIPEPECPAFSEWTGWSDKCMWFPIEEMKEDFATHCDYRAPAEEKEKADEMMKKLKLPEGFSFPDKCGYCSFKLKCSIRAVESTAGKKECFPLRVQKKACGPDDCETCGNVCVVDKMMGSCNITDNIRKLIGPGLKSRLKKAPPGMRDGMMTMIAGMPHGKCIEKDDKCHCCCHPYDLNADGTSCVLKDICKSPEQMGIEVDMNLPAESFWF